jgi:hypothetical protein
LRCLDIGLNELNQTACFSSQNCSKHTSNPRFVIDARAADRGLCHNEWRVDRPNQWQRPHGLGAARGKAQYAVEGNGIVGTSVVNTENTFLCTAEDYSNFILEYEFKVDPRLNSGVQIRSECFPERKEMVWEGKTISIPAGRVHGYQIEIDPEVDRKRMWSAGIYDEARRGWLFPSDGVDGPQGKAFSAQGLRIFKPQDWNHVRVEAIGDSIKTWLNGTPCAQLRDSLTPKGFIALQVHGIGNDRSKAGSQVRWRNLRIKKVSESGSGDAAGNSQRTPPNPSL